MQFQRPEECAITRPVTEETCSPRQNNYWSQVMFIGARKVMYRTASRGIQLVVVDAGRSTPTPE
jgi:hypothetical protein